MECHKSKRLKTITTILTLVVFFITASLPVHAQTENKALRDGSKLYKKGEFDKALPEFQSAVQQNPKNPVANYNLGNTQFRTNDFASAEKAFDAAITSSGADSFKQKAWYNKGVAESKQKKLLESIDAYKNAVKMNPADSDARFNLQKALTELKKQNESQNQKKQDQKKQQKKEQQQKPPPKLDKKKIEQYLQSLQQKEQEVQRKIQQNRTRSVTRPDKDW